MELVNEKRKEQKDKKLNVKKEKTKIVLNLGYASFTSNSLMYLTRNVISTLS
jgi:hypothetical protein